MNQLKDAIINKLVSIIQNPHTSGSGLLIGVTYAAEQIWPQRKSTFEAIRGVAAVWLGVSAGDASKSASKKDVAAAIQSGDTSMLVKSEATKPTNPS